MGIHIILRGTPPLGFQTLRNKVFFGRFDCIFKLSVTEVITSFMRVPPVRYKTIPGLYLRLEFLLVLNRPVFVYKGIKTTSNWNTHWVRHITPGKKGINGVQHYTD